MDVSKDLKPHVECPICLNVPRDGVMLTCLNGHNVCAVCLNKIGRFPKCPQCRSCFNIPPAHNFTVASLVQSFPFEWPCRYQNAVGCKYEGTEALLSSHEAACKKQLPIPCPHHECNETISLGAVVEHFGTAHMMRAKHNLSGSSKGIHWFFKLEVSSLSSDFSWPEVPFSFPSGPVNWLLLCAHYDFLRYGGNACFWLWAPIDVEEADKLECRIRVGDPDAAWSTFIAPVFPMVWNRQKIVHERICVFYDKSAVTQRQVAEGELGDDGSGSKIKVTFEVYRKSNMLLKDKSNLRSIQE